MRKFLGITLFCLFSVLTGYTQEAYLQGGYYVVDASGFVSGALKSSAEVSASHTSGRVYRHIPSANNGSALGFNVNDRISPKFAVSPVNVAADGSTSGTMTMTWAVAAGWDTAANTDLLDSESSTPANTGCPMYGGPTGTEQGLWRLPTQRELQLIWVMYEKLKQLGIPTFASHFYWSATEFSSTNAWYVAFNYGDTSTSNNNNSNTYSVRCVRDL